MTHIADYLPPVIRIRLRHTVPITSISVLGGGSKCSKRLWPASRAETVAAIRQRSCFSCHYRPSPEPSPPSFFVGPWDQSLWLRKAVLSVSRSFGSSSLPAHPSSATRIIGRAGVGRLDRRSRALDVNPVREITSHTDCRLKVDSICRRRSLERSMSLRDIGRESVLVSTKIKTSPLSSVKSRP